MKINKVKLYNRVVLNAEDDAVMYHILNIQGYQVQIFEVDDDNVTRGSGQWIDCCYLQEPTHQQFLNYARSQHGN